MKQEKEALTHKQMMNMSIVYEINLWSYNQGANFTLENYLFGAVKLTKNANSNKYFYSGYGTGCDAHASLSYLMVVGFLKM